jgi:hypothetical protein
MTSKPPPIPPASRNRNETRERKAVVQHPQSGDVEKTDQQARRANIKQNTKNQGYQQDR